MRWLKYVPVYAFVWLFVSGVELDPHSVMIGFLQGMVIGTPLAYVFRDFYDGEMALFRSRHTLWLAADFTREMVKGNLQVAKQILKLDMPIDPEMVEIELEIKDETAITLLANSITLTPGTLVVDYYEESNSLLIHCLNYEEGALEEDVRKWECMLSKIFEVEKHE